MYSVIKGFTLLFMYVVSVLEDLPMVRRPWDCIKRRVLEESKAVHRSFEDECNGSIGSKSEES